MAAAGKRESHRQALRQLLDRYGVHDQILRGALTRDQLVDEILGVGDRFVGSPQWLEEALNSGEGSYKP